MNVRHVRLLAWMMLILLAGAVLAVVWWDWTYTGLVNIWLQGGRVYRFFWQRLLWALLCAEITCLGLWVAAARVSPDVRQGLRRAARPFCLALPALLSFARYRFHPLGVQAGSSLWTYWLIACTAAVLSFVLHDVWRAMRLSRTAHRWASPVVYGMTAAYLCLFGLLSVLRHDAFRTHALDLGTMDQAAWNTIHGRILERTPLYRDPASGSRYENRLLDAKLELAFVPLSALYWLWPDPRVLLIVQTAFLAAGALPLYHHARESTRVPVLALSLAAAYLCYLPLHYVNMADLHPSALMVPFLFAAWLSMRQRRWRWYYLWLVMALCCRIDAAFVALGLGAVIAARQDGARHHGLHTIVLAVLWLVVDLALVVPFVRDVYGPGAGDLFSRRFGILGGSPIDVVRTLVTRPASVLAGLFDRDKAQTIVDLLAPSGFAALLSPAALLPALPVLVINLLAESTWQQSIHAHYMAPVIPFVWIAAAEGLAWLSARSQRMARVLSVYVLLSALFTAWLTSPFPPGRAFRLADYGPPSVYENHLRDVIAHVPPGASVCAQSDLHPHLSQRRDAALFPYCRLGAQEEAEYVVLDLDPTSVKSPLDHHAFYELVSNWLVREDYGVIAREGGALLLQRGVRGEEIDDEMVALDIYGQELYRVEYLDGGVPPELRADDYYRVPLTVRNVGSQSWHSRGQLPVRLSYHWLTERGDPVWDVPALRTDLPHRIAPGQAGRLVAALVTPSEPGTYRLVWDLVREGDAWFGDKGAKMLEQHVTVQ